MTVIKNTVNLSRLPRISAHGMKLVETMQISEIKWTEKKKKKYGSPFLSTTSVWIALAVDWVFVGILALAITSLTGILIGAGLVVASKLIVGATLLQSTSWALFARFTPRNSSLVFKSELNRLKNGHITKMHLITGNLASSKYRFQ